eukprot:TRINITY_DN4803_c0_g1_i1.p1 TRINITY_DN4803_c0_g1~~TRINITY_DN4803_c0_g1_i1.p1  ORF type:complete len:1617 (-),score=211.34 TRINITY_DN4803_c0_g1_i1:73-4923(-)
MNYGNISLTQDTVINCFVKIKGTLDLRNYTLTLGTCASLDANIIANGKILIKYGHYLHIVRNSTRNVRVDVDYSIASRKSGINSFMYGQWDVYSVNVVGLPQDYAVDELCLYSIYSTNLVTCGSYTFKPLNAIQEQPNQITIFADSPNKTVYYTISAVNYVREFYFSVSDGFVVEPTYAIVYGFQYYSSDSPALIVKITSVNSNSGTLTVKTNTKSAQYTITVVNSTVDCSSCGYCTSFNDTNCIQGSNVTCPVLLYEELNIPNIDSISKCGQLHTSGSFNVSHIQAGNRASIQSDLALSSTTAISYLLQKPIYTEVDISGVSSSTTQTFLISMLSFLDDYKSGLLKVTNIPSWYETSLSCLVFTRASLSSSYYIIYSQTCGEIYMGGGSNVNVTTQNNNNNYLMDFTNSSSRYVSIFANQIALLNVSTTDFQPILSSKILGEYHTFVGDYNQYSQVEFLFIPPNFSGNATVLLSGRGIDKTKTISITGITQNAECSLCGDCIIDGVSPSSCINGVYEVDTLYVNGTLKVNCPTKVKSWILGSGVVELSKCSSLQLVSPYFQNDDITIIITPGIYPHKFITITPPNIQINITSLNKPSVGQTFTVFTIAPYTKPVIYTLYDQFPAWYKEVCLSNYASYDYSGGTLIASNCGFYSVSVYYETGIVIGSSVLYANNPDMVLTVEVNYRKYSSQIVPVDITASNSLNLSKNQFYIHPFMKNSFVLSIKENATLNDGDHITISTLFESLTIYVKNGTTSSFDTSCVCNKACNSLDNEGCFANNTLRCPVLTANNVNFPKYQINSITECGSIYSLSSVSLDIDYLTLNPSLNMAPINATFIYAPQNVLYLNLSLLTNSSLGSEYILSNGDMNRKFDIEIIDFPQSLEQLGICPSVVYYKDLKISYSYYSYNYFFFSFYYDSYFSSQVITKSSAVKLIDCNLVNVTNNLSLLEEYVNTNLAKNLIYLTVYVLRIEFNLTDNTTTIVFYDSNVNEECIDSTTYYILTLMFESQLFFSGTPETILIEQTPTITKFTYGTNQTYPVMQVPLFNGTLYVFGQGTVSPGETIFIDTLKSLIVQMPFVDCKVVRTTFSSDNFSSVNSDTLSTNNGAVFFIFPKNRNNETATLTVHIFGTNLTTNYTIVQTDSVYQESACNCTSITSTYSNCPRQRTSYAQEIKFNGCGALYSYNYYSSSSTLFASPQLRVVISQQTFYFYSTLDLSQLVNNNLGDKVVVVSFTLNETYTTKPTVPKVVNLPSKYSQMSPQVCAKLYLTTEYVPVFYNTTITQFGVKFALCDNSCPYVCHKNATCSGTTCVCNRGYEGTGIQSCYRTCGRSSIPGFKCVDFNWVPDDTSSINQLNIDGTSTGITVISDINVNTLVISGKSDVLIIGDLTSSAGNVDGKLAISGIVNISKSLNFTNNGLFLVNGSTTIGLLKVGTISNVSINGSSTFRNGIILSNGSVITLDGDSSIGGLSLQNSTVLVNGELAINSVNYIDTGSVTKVSKCVSVSGSLVITNQYPKEGSYGVIETDCLVGRFDSVQLQNASDPCLEASPDYQKTGIYITIGVKFECTTTPMWIGIAFALAFILAAVIFIILAYRFKCIGEKYLRAFWANKSIDNFTGGS